MNIEILRDAGHLSALKPEWAALFDRCPAAPPFLHPGWQLAWWTLFGTCEVHTLALRDGERLCALAACFRHEERLVFIGNGISDRLDILAEDRQAAQRMVAALQEYALDLQEIAADSPLLSLPHEPCSVSPALDLTRETPRTIRRNVKAARKLLDGKGRVSLLFSPEPRYLDDLFCLHAARWHAEGQSGVLAGERVEQFHRIAARELSEKGMLRMHAVLVNDAVIAVVYAFARNGTVYSYLGGYDPAWQNCSPGTLSIHAAIEYARSAGDRWFDFLRGPEGYKYAWGAEDRVQFRLNLQPGPGMNYIQRLTGKKVR